MDQEIITLQEQIKTKMTEKRFEHTLGVSYTCAALAMRYGCDVRKARIAGLLHDNAKCFSDEEMLRRCEENGIPIREVERRNPYLLHGRLGAFYAKQRYGIEDTDILHSIEYHTTGREDMSLLEQIVFVADFIEPNRAPIPNLDQIRTVSFEQLERGVALILESTLNFLRGKANGRDCLDERTEQAYQYYKNQL